MRSKIATLPSFVARTTKYAWVVVATLIVTLVLWGFIAAPRVFATDIRDSSMGPTESSDLPFGLQSGLVTARLNVSGQPVAPLALVGGTGLPFGLQSGLVTARLNASGQPVAPLALVGGTGLPFGLQSGLVTARLNASGQLVAPLALVGGTGLPFGLESGLVTAGIDPSFSVDASSARWAALGDSYIAKSEAISSARSDAPGDYYSSKSEEAATYLRMFGGSDDEFLAANPELIVVRNFNPAMFGGSDDEFLAANPEVRFARSFYGQGTGACVVERPDSILAINPELAYVQQFEAC